MSNLLQPIPIEDRALLQQTAAYYEQRELVEISVDLLRRITREHGVDFATALLYHHTMKSESLCHFLTAPHCESDERSRMLLGIVPGAFYIEHPETGADGRRLREAASSLRYDCTVIPAASVGTLAENAEIIIEWLKKNAGRRLVLASLSKGGADIKAALQTNPTAFASVIGWLNIGGTTQGSPIVSWILSRRLPTLIAQGLFWWRKRNMQFLYDLERAPRARPKDEFGLPVQMRAIHVLGFPLRRHLSTRRARTWHRRLASEGPNDAATFLFDACELPGFVFPVWGADHYAADRVDWRDFLERALQYFQNASESRARAYCLPLGGWESNTAP